MLHHDCLETPTPAQMGENSKQKKSGGDRAIVNEQTHRYTTLSKRCENNPELVFHINQSLATQAQLYFRTFLAINATPFGETLRFLKNLLEFCLKLAWVLRKSYTVSIFHTNFVRFLLLFEGSFSFQLAKTFERFWLSFLSNMLALFLLVFSKCQ